MNVIEIIKEKKLVPVIKIDELETTVPLLRALQKGGIKVAEITYRTACAQEAIKTAIENFPIMAIGAGTVVNDKQAEQALRLGVKFVVSPGFDEKIALRCKDNLVPYFGGCVTPTEIMRAMDLGFDIVKFFPAQAMGGLKTIKSLAAPFPSVKFMPTGGINLDNLKEYLSFEKVIACGGSWMVKSELIKNRDYEKITKLCEEAVREVENI